MPVRTLVLGERLPARVGSPAILAGAFALPALLLLARLLPDHGLGLWIRLAVAAACVLLLPGALLVCAVGWPRDLGVAIAGAFAWSLAFVFVALAVTFGVGGSLNVALGLLGVFAVAALLPAVVAPQVEVRPRNLAAVGAVAGAGVLLSVVVWAASGPVVGDGLFHLARVRKLVDLDHLTSLQVVDEFRDGGLHPGYAFPLWHGAVALISRLAGVDPALTARFLSAVLVPLSLVLVFAAGRALFRSSWLGGATVLAQATLIGLGPGHGGGYTSLVQPGTASRQLILPAILALTFAYVHERNVRLLPTIAAAGLVLALTHPTYSLYLALLLGGFLLTRALLAGKDMAAIAATLAAVVVPAGAAAFWLLPIVRDTASHEPSAVQLARDVAHYGQQLDVSSPTSFRLAPEIVSRSGAVAVAALLLVPLAGFAARRRWAAFVLGGALTVLVLVLVPELFTRLSDVVSLSQARRLAGFLPFAVAFAGGLAVLSRLLGAFVLPVALGAGVGLQWAYPGDFGTHLEIGGPAVATWIAAFGGAAALAFAMAFGARIELERDGPVVAAAAALFVLPIAIHGLREWGQRPGGGGNELTPGLVQTLRANVPQGDVVLSDLATSYQIAAAAPVYVASAPPAHVADTSENRPYERRRETLRFFRTGNLRIARRFGAQWIVIDKRTSDLALPLPRAYTDRRFVVYRL
jgi:hypothetical protein